MEKERGQKEQQQLEEKIIKILANIFSHVIRSLKYKI